MSEKNSQANPESADRGQRVASPFHRWLTNEQFGGGVLIIVLVEIILGASGRWSSPEVKFLLFVGIAWICYWTYGELRLSGKSNVFALTSSAAIMAVLSLLTLGAYTIYNRKLDGFSVRYSWFYNMGPKPSLWLVRNGMVTPLDSAMLTLVTNRSGKPSMINSFSVESKTKDGEYETISPRFGAGECKIYAGSNPKAVREIALPTLESAVEGKDIADGDTVTGWVFLTDKWTIELRFVVMNSLGDVSVEPFTALADNQTTGYDSGWPLNQPSDSNLSHDSQDISKLPRAK